jgi:uncharacterized protein YcfJ
MPKGRIMKKKLTAVVVTGLAFVTVSAFAQEVGRVISSTPLVQQVGVPRQVCTTQPTVVSEQKTGAGAVMGALAGGGLGNAVGQGTGRALATMAGVMGGAILGNSIEGGGQQVQNVQTCSTQTFYETRNVGYTVVYEYGGKQYSVQMPTEPGPTLQLQVTPVGASSAAPQTGQLSDLQDNQIYPQQAAQYPQGQYSQGVVTTQTYVQPTYVQPAYVAQPVYTAPVYSSPYYAPYYAPIGLSLGFGYRGGYYGGHRGGGRRH